MNVEVGDVPCEVVVADEGAGVVVPPTRWVPAATVGRVEVLEVVDAGVADILDGLG